MDHEKRDFSDLDNQESNPDYAGAIRDGSYNPAELRKREENFGKEGYKRGSLDNITDAENSATSDANWGVNLDEKGGTHSSRGEIAKSKTAFGKARAFLKGKGPAGALVGGLGLTGIIVGAFGSLLVSMGPVHLMQNFMQKFNFPGVSSNVRMPKVFRVTNNINGHKSTSGIINKKFNGMNQNMIDRMAKEGIEVQLSGNKLSNGSFEVSGIKDLKNNKIIEAGEFNSYRATNPDFNARFQTGVSTKFTVMKDKVSSKWRQTFNIKETGIQNAKDGNKELPPEELSETINEKANNIDSDKASISETKVGQELDDNGKPIDIDGSESVIDDIGTTESNYNSTMDELKKASAEANPSAATRAARAIGTLGVIQDICGYAQTANTLSRAGKVLRAVQLAGYAMTFMQVASKMMAGDAGAQEVAQIGTVLMSEITYQKAGKQVRSSAMDSPGVKYALTGSMGGASDATSEYTIGDGTGGLFSGDGALGGVLNWVRSYGDKVCGPMNSSAGTLVSLGISFIPVGGWIAKGVSGGAMVAVNAAKASIVNAFKNMTLKTGISITAQAISSLASVFAPQIAQLLTGKIVGDFTNGIDAGEAISSGFLVAMAMSGMNRGNLALTNDQALAYYDLQTEQIAQEAELDRQKRSPFDPTSPNTFLGSIISKSLPYTSTIVKPANMLSSIGSIAGSSFKSLLPSASAEDKQSFKDFTSKCEDDAIKQLGASADMYCNPITGIPTEYINVSTDEVIEYLANNNQFDSNDEPKDKLKEFQTTCVETSNVYGLDENSDSSWASFFGARSGLDGWKRCTAIDEGNGWTVKDKAFYALYFQDVSLAESLQTWGETETSDSSSSTSAESGSIEDGKKLTDEYYEKIFNPGSEQSKIQNETGYSFSGLPEQCYALSMYYAWKVSGGKAKNPGGHGVNFAPNISAQAGWKLVSKATPGAIFSSSHGNLGAVGGYGHTGIIWGEEGDNYIILDNNYPGHEIYHKDISGGGGIGLRAVPKSSVDGNTGITFAVYEGGN